MLFDFTCNKHKVYGTLTLNFSPLNFKINWSGSIIFGFNNELSWIINIHKNHGFHNLHLSYFGQLHLITYDRLYIDLHSDKRKCHTVTG